MRDTHEKRGVKNGIYNTACCPNVKFDGNIDALRTNAKLTEALFKKANPIEYSIDYLLLHICKTGSISVLQIKDVISIYALDNSAYSIGIDMNPSITLNTPIWQEAFERFQIKTNISKALEGVKLIEELFRIIAVRIIRKTKCSPNTKRIVSLRKTKCSFSDNLFHPQNSAKLFF